MDMHTKARFPSALFAGCVVACSSKPRAVIMNTAMDTSNACVNY